MKHILINSIRKLIPSVVTIISGPIRGFRWCSRSGSQRYWLGTYERNKQMNFFDSLSSGEIVYDIGAHTGLYALIASKATGATGHVYIFEPLDRNVSFIERNLSLNSVTNATLFPVAVSDECGEAFFDLGADHLMGHLAEQGTVSVNVTTIDFLMANDDIKPPDTVKIDVEGAEIAVLEGASAMLHDIRPKIFLAIHGSKQYQGCCKILREANYHIETTDEQRDIRVGTFYFDYISEIVASPQ